MKLVFCTNNSHKLEEVAQIMGPNWSFSTLKDIGYSKDIPEPYDSLELNSLTKANQVFEQTSLPCFAEDTGLFVESLGGQPGVYSARYAGNMATSDDNIQKLLNELKGHTNRNAYFKTVITLLTHEGMKQFSGICEGDIAQEHAGISGFGYDPIFIPKGYEITFAEMAAEEKNGISHRFKAFTAFSHYLRQVNSKM